MIASKIMQSNIEINFLIQICRKWTEDIDWDMRTQELMNLLTATAPQLQSLFFQESGLSPHRPSAYSAALSQLSQLSQLTSLSLSIHVARVTTAEVDTIVQGLPSLQSLDLTGGQRFLKDDFPVGIATSCSQLQHLHVWGAYFVRAEAMPDFGCLTRLTSLKLGCYCSSLPASISHLTGLRDVEVCHDFRYTELPEQLWHLESITRLSLDLMLSSLRFFLDGGLSNSISRLTALHNLTLMQTASCTLPEGLTACRQLTHLTLRTDVVSPVVARLQSLRSFEVMMLPHQLPHNTYWTQLSGLTQLSESVSGCHVSQFSGISGMTSLRNLVLIGSSGLPEGPYLSRLQRLSLLDCDYKEGIPPALQDAAQLQTQEITPHFFGIDDDDDDNDDDDDDDAAAAAFVMKLPAALKTLTLVYADIPRVTAAEAWNWRVSHMRAAFIADGRVPPVIKSNLIIVP